MSAFLCVCARVCISVRVFHTAWPRILRWSSTLAVIPLVLAPAVRADGQTQAIPQAQAGLCTVGSPIGDSHVMRHVAATQELSVITYLTRVQSTFGHLQVTAEAHGLYPRIIGYGEKAWWPDGLGAKINAMRRFVLSEVTDDEIVLCVDAFDVLIFAGRAEIIWRFEELERQHNRSIFFNAEESCWPCSDDMRKNYPRSEFPQWRYLNSGIFIGRGLALKKMFQDSVDDVMPAGDQAFFQSYLANFPDRVGLDTHCHLLCLLHSYGPSQQVPAAWRGGRLRIQATGSTPCVVHFPGEAHVPHWTGNKFSSYLNEVFYHICPAAAERLYGAVEITVSNGGTKFKSLSLRRVSALVVNIWILLSPALQYGLLASVLLMLGGCCYWKRYGHSPERLLERRQSSDEETSSTSKFVGA